MKKFSPSGNIFLKKIERKKLVQNLKEHFKSIIDELGFNLNDPDIKNTPYRLAKTWVNELLDGRYSAKPEITIFPNRTYTDGTVTLGNIGIKSICSHHMMPFYGKCFIGYIPNKTIIGISKISRICNWFARRAQTQENLTRQIMMFIYDELKPKGVIVHLICTHTCMTMRGINENTDSRMVTTDAIGDMNTNAMRIEFMKYVDSISQR